MENISVLKERWLKQEIAALKGKGVSKADIADKLGIKPQYLNNIINGGRGITDAFLDKFIEAFSINQFDLLNQGVQTDETTKELLNTKDELITAKNDIIAALHQRITDLETHNKRQGVGLDTARCVDTMPDAGSQHPRK